MKFEYKLSIDELVTQNVAYDRVEGSRAKTLKWFYVFMLLFSIHEVASAYIDGKKGNAIVLLICYSSLNLVYIYLCLSKRATRWTARLRLVKYLKSDKSLLEKHIIEVKDNRLIHTFSGISIEVTSDNIGAMIEEDGSLMISSRDGFAFLSIPLRVFETIEEKNLFIKKIKGA